MKVKVISDFNDKYTNKLRKKGDEIEISKKRFQELEKAGKFVAKVEEKED